MVGMNGATSIGWCDERGVTHYGTDEPATWRQFHITTRIGPGAIIALPPEYEHTGFGRLLIAALLGSELDNLLESTHYDPPEVTS